MHYSSGNYEAFVRPRKPEGMSPAAQFDDFTGDLILTREALLEAQGLALAIDVALSSGSKREFAMHYSSGNYEAFVRPRKPEGADRKTAFILADVARRSVRRLHW
jgi:myosin-crossreactive antigen